MICGPQIQTASGLYFDLLEPNPAHVKVSDIATALSKISRFTGHTRSFYSVAQHSVMVSFLVPAHDAIWGLFHDAAEAYLGDVATPLKQLLPDYKAIEERVEAVVFEALGLPGEMPPTIKQADLIMLATEKRDLMPAGNGEAWKVLDGINPIATHIEPWLPEQAEARFLRRAMQLLEDTCLSQAA